MKKNCAVCIILCVLAYAAAAEQSESTVAEDMFFIGGKAYNKQVFRKTPSGIVQITRFKRWENVQKYFISPDRKMLLVYHRPDKAQAYLITLYDLRTNAVIAECEPGWACFGVRWKKDYLVYMWATSGGGMRFEYRDYKNLKTAFVLNSYGYWEDLEDEILLFYPIYPAGAVSVYDYTTGKEIPVQSSAGQSSYVTGTVYDDRNDSWNADIQKIGFHKYKIGIVFMDDTKASIVIEF